MGAADRPHPNTSIGQPSRPVSTMETMTVREAHELRAAAAERDQLKASLTALLDAVDEHARKKGFDRALYTEANRIKQELGDV